MIGESVHMDLKKNHINQLKNDMILGFHDIFLFSVQMIQAIMFRAGNPALWMGG